MNEKKNLEITAMICDLREVNEEVLNQYGEISIESMIVYVTEESQEILNRHHVQIEAMILERLDLDVELLERNGTFTITPGFAENKKLNLIVNGRLIIEPGSAEALTNYVHIQVNGEVICPESLSIQLSSRLTCNGNVKQYPDSCILADGLLTADRVFALRAKADSQYYVTGKALFLGSSAQYVPLLEKNVRIICSQAIVAESSLDTVIQILDEKADVTLVPDGCQYVNASCCLDDAFVYRYGSKAYIDANVTVKDTGLPEGLEFLHIKGDVSLPEEYKADFLKICKNFSRILTFRGKWISDVTDLVIDKALLESSPKGLNVSDCVNVRITDDVSAELISERLTLDDCVNITCPKNLISVIQTVATDYVLISPPEDEKDTDDNPFSEHTVTIKTMKYKM